MPAETTLVDLLRTLVENEGSDLHLQCNEPPRGRIHGQLGRFETAPLTEADVLRFARELLGSEDKFKEFLATKDSDAAIAIPELGRFRANLFYQRDQPGMVLRTIGTKIRGIAALDLNVVRNIVVSWVVTLPIAAILSVFFFYFFQGFLGA